MTDLERNEHQLPPNLQAVDPKWHPFFHALLERVRATRQALDEPPKNS